MSTLILKIAFLDIFILFIYMLILDINVFKKIFFKHSLFVVVLVGRFIYAAVTPRFTSSTTVFLVFLDEVASDSTAVMASLAI